MLALVRRLLSLRRGAPVLRQRAFFEGRPVADGDGCKDLAWFHPAGHEMSSEDWFAPEARSIGMYLDGRGLRHRDRRGELIVDDSYLVLLNSGEAETTFALPGEPWGRRYRLILDSTRPGGEPAAPDEISPGDLIVPACSVFLLRVVRASER
jgi:glycogen operon protein